MELRGLFRPKSNRSNLNLHKSYFSMSISVSILAVFLFTFFSSLSVTECAKRQKHSKDLNLNFSLSEDSQGASNPLKMQESSITNNNITSTSNKSGKAKIRSTTSRASRDQSTPHSKSSPGKSNQAKQSWLAVASAVAHSAATETNHQLPIGDDSKPTKYHYYPHNQHLYLLPECATQQVCSAVYLRLNYSQPLCACPNFHEPCSVSTRTDDRHTIPLVTGSQSQVLTLVKTCEPTHEVRECRAPKDWSILALQNSRTGKAHYLVICRCPSPGYLEGPIAHSQPAYARVPGIRVYGMTCVRAPSRLGRNRGWDAFTTSTPTTTTKVEQPKGPNPAFPWHRLKSLLQSAGLIS